MRPAVWLALALAGCTAAPAVLEPPPPFDAGPVPAHLTISVPYFEINSICGNTIPGTRAEACAMPTVLGLRIVVLPIAGRDGVTQDMVDALARHEDGHLRGWPADHHH